MIERSYDIHGLVRVRLISRHRSVLEGLDYPLSFFETNQRCGKPEIVLDIGDFPPSNQGSYLVNHRFHVKDNYIYCEERTGRARMKWEVEGFENGPIEIRFHGKAVGAHNLIAPNLLAHDQLLMPMIEQSLARKGLFLAHGCGIVTDGSAQLFLGRGGARKTTVVLDAVARKSRILGDDRVILDPSGGKAYSFPQFSRIVEYLVEKKRNERLGMMMKMALIHRLHKNPPQAESFWASEPSRVTSLNLLTPRCSMRSLEKQRIDRASALRMMTANNMAEQSASSLPGVNRKTFPESVTAYSLVFQDSWIAGYWEGIEELLKRLPDDITFFRIVTPTELSRRDCHELHSES